jgi:hypothetical protein
MVHASSVQQVPFKLLSTTGVGREAAGVIQGWESTSEIKMIEMTA